MNDDDLLIAAIGDDGAAVWPQGTGVRELEGIVVRAVPVFPQESERDGVAAQFAAVLDQPHTCTIPNGGIGRGQ